MGKSSINGPLSMAILDNQRVPNIIDKKNMFETTNTQDSHDLLG